VKATTIFSDGFESGDFSAWTGTSTGKGGSISVDTSQVHHGTYAAKAIQGGLDAWAVAYKNFATTYSIIYARSYVQLSSLPSSGVRLYIYPCIFEGSAAAHILVGACVYNDAGTLKWDLRYRTDSVEENHAYSTTPTINANQWYCVEVKFVKGSGNGEVGLYIDGNLVISVTGLTNNAYSAGRLEVGVYSTSATYITVYHDCVVVADTYIGPEAEVQPEYDYVDLFGMNAPNLTVKIWRISDGALMATLKTDKNGLTEPVKLPAGQYSIEIYKDEKLQLQQIITLNKDTTLEIQIGIPVAIPFNIIIPAIIAATLILALIYITKRRKR
jgi:hypothetical protein